MKYNLEVDLSIKSSHSLILSRIKPRSKVLEFGPATGYMTRYIKEKLQCEIVCVEIDTEAAAKAEVYADKMIVSDINALSWKEDIDGLKFDYILFADVLEHLYNPGLVLATASEFLEEGGYVMTSIPNISHNSIILELMEGRFNYQQIGLLDNTHIRFFTRESVLKLLSDCDLEPVEWLTTMRRPNSTEFNQDYNKLPVPVRNFLKTRIDGEVYQFVTVSQKSTEPEANITRFQVEQYQNYLDKDYCQFYWAKDKRFSENNSQNITISDKSFSLYRFKIPEGAWNSLRFDPANTIVLGEIKNIRLICSNSIVKEISNEAITESVNTVILENNAVIRFVSLGDDPQLLFQDLSRYTKSGCVIEFEMKVEDNIATIIEECVNYIHHYVDLYNTQQEQTNQYRVELKEHKAKNNMQLKLLNEEIERLGAQNVQLDNELKSKIYDFEMEIGLLNNQLEDICKREEKLKKEINAITSSLSWKITAPLRRLFDYIGNRKTKE
ncbi:methyltransferase domain-containing protein [Paenibacillus sp. FSL M8-0334]|uniref:class I SAM-dependent methyltransferase n=1 Tax=Paenibacillus sp. FSL M8-0334 TaxID=2921623 RepID=UPI0030F9618F